MLAMGAADAGKSGKFVAMDLLTARAMTAAAQVAGSLGLRGVTPVLLKDASNALIHLAPSPVVARVATTASLLRPSTTWLQRDLDVAAYLHGLGAPVVPPSEELPPGPHLWSAAEGSETAALTFWTFFEHDREHRPTAEEAMVRLAELHCALKDFALPGLPYMSLVLDEIPHWLKVLELRRLLSGQDLMELRASHWRLAQQLRSAHIRTQVLHGDAHAGNMLRTPAGLLWTDFEDTCTGPVAWDVAILLHHERAKRAFGDQEELLELYPDAPAWSELQPYFDARELVSVVYMQLQANRYPDRAPEAARLLTQWRRRLG